MTTRIESWENGTDWNGMRTHSMQVWLDLWESDVEDIGEAVKGRVSGDIVGTVDHLSDVEHLKGMGGGEGRESK